jgi:hypothetical protein
MLRLEKVLAQGRTRTVYQHPSDPAWVVKVVTRHTWRSADKLSLIIRSTLQTRFPFLSVNHRDLDAYTKLHECLKGFIPEYRTTLVTTDRGKGLMTRMIVNDDATMSATLSTHLLQNQTPKAELQASFRQFFDLLARNKIYFFDFNHDNFLIQNRDGQETLWFIDLKGYRKDKSFLPLTYLFPKQAEKKMIRRIQRFYDRLNRGRPPG